MKFVRILHSVLIAAVLVFFASMELYCQEDIYFEELLQRTDTIENPVYKPMISIGYGTLNFVGDVKSTNKMPGTDNPAFRLSVSTFLDNSHHVLLNFSFLSGTLSGEKRSITDAAPNLNFKSDIRTIGASAKYEFGHFLSDQLKFRPYISLGIEQLNFTTNGDLYDSNGTLYHYWPDGSTRNVSSTVPGTSVQLHRDYVYETNLEKFERDNFNLGYSTNSFAIPAEVGFSLKVSPRVSFNIGTEYHYTFTDYIDNVAARGTSVAGNRAKDGYFLTHATLQFDMFSEPKTRTVELLFADIEFDPLFFGDEDGDFVLDNADRCLGTPYGVVTDTLGCPLDTDSDGVPDYLDMEPDSPDGRWVDEQGVTITEDELLVRLSRDKVMNRDDLEAYLELIRGNYLERRKEDIPEKFAMVDLDEDGYISFDELLKVIDGYFDFTVDLSIDELRELNEFFFSQ